MEVAFQNPFGVGSDRGGFQAFSTSRQDSERDADGHHPSGQRHPEKPRCVGDEQDESEIDDEHRRRKGDPERSALRDKLMIYISNCSEWPQACRPPCFPSVSLDRIARRAQPALSPIIPRYCHCAPLRQSHARLQGITNRAKSQPAIKPSPPPLSSGSARSGDAAREAKPSGSGSRSLPTTGSRRRESNILGRATALPSNTQRGSPMRESRPYASTRGALRNERPYRDPFEPLARSAILVGCAALPPAICYLRDGE